MSNAWIDAREREQEWPYGRGRVAADIGNHERIVVTFGLRKLASDERPYWSITGEIVDKRKRGDNAIVTSGAIHRKILEHFPELAPIVALHLSDDRGRPMYAIEDGRYWLGLTASRTAEMRDESDAMVTVDLPHVPTLRNHLRVDEQEAAYFVGRRGDYRADPLAFVADVEALYERWESESESARHLLASYT